jgi:hypothetical protein
MWLPQREKGLTKSKGEAELEMEFEKLNGINKE